MEFQTQPYIVYVRPNDSGYITAIDSSAFLPNPEGWVEIDRGYGDKYHHAQGHYFPGSVLTDSGVYRFKLDGGKPVECTPEEIAQQEAELPPDTPSGGGAAELDELDEAYEKGVNSL